MNNKSFHVAIIGAGMSGLYIAKRLKERNISYVMYEKAEELGGTWRDNKYPGLLVDVPVHEYQLNFAPKYDWSHAYAPGAEIQDYLVQVAQDHDLRKDIKFGTDIVATSWTGTDWELSTAGGATHRADTVVSATGFLRVPTLPRLKGMDTFAGASFHSSAWPDDLDLHGKRVGVVGTGSSGIQIVSALANMNVEVTQFVRTPQWVETIENPPATQDLLDRVRRNPAEGPKVLQELVEGINQDPSLRDLRWKTRGAGPAREAASQALRDDLLAVKDPELRRILTPDFPPGCKRVPKSHLYYQAVQKPNVRIVPHGVAQVQPDGVVTPDGEVHKFDVIVYATGFDAHAYMRPMNVTGVGGIDLDEAWRHGPFSYRGVAVPDFPNFFLLHGPFSPVNNVPVPRTLEDETGYICRLIEKISQTGVALAPTSEATKKFRESVKNEIPNTVWAHGCANWYQDGEGVPVIWPWYVEEHKRMMEDLDLTDFEAVTETVNA